MDTHYTPSAIAKSLVAAVSHLKPRLIADLAAGKGHLLFEAEHFWPSATILATDIDHNAIVHLANIRPSWKIGRCDLRNARSRSSCQALRNTLASVCLLLLNPPFSCRGGTRYSVHTSQGHISASAGLSFLILATHYLAKDGNIVSILPYGCFTSARDAEAWDYLKTRFLIEIVEIHPSGAFPGSAARTALVRLSPIRSFPILLDQHSGSQHPGPILPVTVARGGCQIHRLIPNSSRPPLVHYTDIRNGKVVPNGRRGSGPHKCIQGPAVFIPRVGRITTDKVAVMDNITSVMLSDCVIAIKPNNSSQLYTLRDRMIENFVYLREQYIGTGAPFITINRLCAALDFMGVQVV